MSDRYEVYERANFRSWHIIDTRTGKRVRAFNTDEHGSHAEREAEREARRLNEEGSVMSAKFEDPYRVKWNPRKFHWEVLRDPDDKLIRSYPCELEMINPWETAGPLERATKESFRTQRERASEFADVLNETYYWAHHPFEHEEETPPPPRFKAVWFEQVNHWQVVDREGNRVVRSFGVDSGGSILGKSNFDQQKKLAEEVVRALNEYV